eukprot:TRINITY_DN60870_c0_g1_i2.p1 TRINITY_DN60870_c0_g1~~TRINITY_DN60870_c0_g1_i2.p1  ORF type:complete len:124 (-),score=19.06 TRINITY_DN60870_c0_g1_i2:67-438(-)
MGADWSGLKVAATFVCHDAWVLDEAQAATFLYHAECTLNECRAALAADASDDVEAIVDRVINHMREWTQHPVVRTRLRGENRNVQKVVVFKKTILELEKTLDEMLQRPENVNDADEDGDQDAV